MADSLQGGQPDGHPDRPAIQCMTAPGYRKPQLIFAIRMLQPAPGKRERLIALR
jgi:hypothetical protein